MGRYQFMTGGDLTERWVYDGSGRIIYWGEAKAGTADAAPNWRIRIFAYTGASFSPDSKKWASGTPNFDKVWDDRTTYSYT